MYRAGFTSIVWRSFRMDECARGRPSPGHSIARGSAVGSPPAFGSFF
jgi:hypothetical protein